MLLAQIGLDWPGLAWILQRSLKTVELERCVYILFDVDFIQKERFNKTFYRDQKDYILTGNN